MKLEGIVTCVNYGDFLAHTLPLNRALFNKLVVVTSPEDKLTQRVCEYWTVMCIQTDAFGAKEGKFRKGAGINVGLEHLDKDGWVIHMDGDIVLPPLTREVLDRAQLDQFNLYGADRFMVPNFEEWQKFKSNPRLLHENRSWIHLDALPLGVRVAIDNYQGYSPIGFFQLWHPGASKVTKYPEGHDSAAREDLKFALQWARHDRGIIPEMVVYHLESEKADMGENWNGRKTKPFGPAPKFPERSRWWRTKNWVKDLISTRIYTER